MWPLIIDCQENIDNPSNYLRRQPGYLQACERHGDQPARDHDLSALRLIGAAVPLMSVSGGTDIVSALAIGAPTAPVWPGEIACPALGVDMPDGDYWMPLFVVLDDGCELDADTGPGRRSPCRARGAGGRTGR
jgi:hypothetical protein